MKTIQVFLVGDETAEVSGTLTSLKLKDGVYTIKYTEDDKEVYVNYIPIAQVRFIRVFK